MQGQASQDILDETGGIQGGMVLDKGAAQAGFELSHYLFSISYQCALHFRLRSTEFCLEMVGMN